MENRLLKLIEDSHSIFITSHISPDPDAISSTVLLSQTLKINFPKKQITAVLEEKPDGLSYIEGFEDIVFGPVLDSLENLQPDLFIILDGNNFERCSRHDGQRIRDFLRSNHIKTAAIDHHEPEGRDDFDIFINNHSAATAQDVYLIFVDGLGMERPEQAAETAMTGFYADTGGFVYVKDGSQVELFGFAAKLVGEGADIEAIKNRLESYTENDMLALSELAKNITHQNDYSFSFLSDEFIADWHEKGLDHLSLQRPTNTFLNNYIRNIGGRTWGFIVYKNIAQGENTYSASWRSQGGRPDVSALARRLGGGGHKPAAGAKFEASSLEAACRKVQAVIAESA